MMTAFELIEANGLTLHGDIEHYAELVRADERQRRRPDSKADHSTSASGQRLAESHS